MKSQFAGKHLQYCIVEHLEFVDNLLIGIQRKKIWHSKHQIFHLSSNEWKFSYNNNLLNMFES